MEGAGRSVAIKYELGLFGGAGAIGRRERERRTTNITYPHYCCKVIGNSTSISAVLYVILRWTDSKEPRWVSTLEIKLYSGKFLVFGCGILLTPILFELVLARSEYSNGVYVCVCVCLVLINQTFLL